MAYIVIYFDGNETAEESVGALANMLHLAKHGHKIELKWGTPKNPIHIDTQETFNKMYNRSLETLENKTPTFKINDMVVTTETLTSDNAYMIPGSRENISTPYIVLQNQQGIIEKSLMPNDDRCKVNFGAVGIWYVPLELLKPRP